MSVDIWVKMKGNLDFKNGKRNVGGKTWLLFYLKSVFSVGFFFPYSMP